MKIEEIKKEITFKKVASREPGLDQYIATFTLSTDYLVDPTSAEQVGGEKYLKSAVHYMLTDQLIKKLEVLMEIDKK